MPAERLSEHFTVAELACRCCGACDLDADFLARLEGLRLAYGRLMLVTSGYRCPAHNQEVSSSGAEGPHTEGRAVDVAVAGPAARELIRLALEHDFRGLGLRQHGRWAKRFVHLDTVPRPVPLIWSYV